MFKYRKILFLIVIGALFIVSSCKKETPVKKAISTDTIVYNLKVNKKLTRQKNHPIMVFEKNEHDFGIINSGDQVVYDFKFKNAGNRDLIITDAKGSCGCTVPEFPKEPIKPGASGKIRVQFNSVGKLGEQSKTVRITANTYKGRERIKIKATIKPRVENTKNKQKKLWNK